MAQRACASGPKSCLPCSDLRQRPRYGRGGTFLLPSPRRDGVTSSEVRKPTRLAGSCATGQTNGVGHVGSESDGGIPPEGPPRLFAGGALHDFAASSWRMPPNVNAGKFPLVGPTGQGMFRAREAGARLPWRARNAPLAAGRKRSQRSAPHPVFPAGGCTTCAGPSPQGCSASACASKSPRRY
jgi:hypothetical protein